MLQFFDSEYKLNTTDTAGCPDAQCRQRVPSALRFRHAPIGLFDPIRLLIPFIALWNFRRFFHLKSVHTSIASLAAGLSCRVAASIPSSGDRHAPPIVEPPVPCSHRCSGPCRNPRSGGDPRYPQKKENSSLPQLLLLELRQRSMGTRQFPPVLLLWTRRVALLQPISRKLL